VFPAVSHHIQSNCGSRAGRRVPALDLVLALKSGLTMESSTVTRDPTRTTICCKFDLVPLTRLYGSSWCLGEAQRGRDVSSGVKAERDAGWGSRKRWHREYPEFANSVSVTRPRAQALQPFIGNIHRRVFRNGCRELDLLLQLTRFLLCGSVPPVRQGLRHSLGADGLSVRPRPAGGRVAEALAGLDLDRGARRGREKA
jgi:hypothetical protein